MKRYHYILTTLALSVSLQASSNPISKAEARIVAQTFVAIADSSSDEVAQSPYYVFSRGANKGYVIVSGDDEVAPVLGYTEQGDFQYNTLPEPLQQMLVTWSEKILHLQAEKTTQWQSGKALSVSKSQKASVRLAVSDYKSAWQDVAALVQTHWHQSYPYNMLAPHRTDNGNQALSGCEATAASQIIYYFRKDNPTSLLYNTPTYSYGGAPVTVSLPKGKQVRYDLMKLSGTGSLAQDSAVAVLMYAAGTSAYLTYGYQDGTATAGETKKMGAAISGQFSLNNTYAYKGNYTQTNWEQLVYNSLLAGKPLLYSGSNSSSGGHAVVLDGYQAKTGLYHFNFGWGGQGDGYYTIDDATGMNGFSSSQEILVNITPATPKLTGHIIPTQLYERSKRPIQAMIHNDGTLSQQKFHLYCTYTSTKPTQPTVSETTTVVASGDSAIISFSYSPMRTQPLHLYLYDDNNRLLDTLTITVKPTQAALHLNQISVDAGSEIITLDGMKFQQVNHTKAFVNVNLTNGEGGTYCQPIFRCVLFEYDTDTHAWKPDSIVKMMLNMTFEEGQTRDTAFVYTNLKDGSYYKARMVKDVVAGMTTPLQVDTPDSVVYFRTATPTLVIAAPQGRTAHVTGAWDTHLFQDQATNAQVTCYDIKEVTSLSSQPQAANPNALFFTATPLPGTRNVVQGDVCDSLVIQSSHEFWSAQPFTAHKARLVMSTVQPGKWSDMAVPFTATVPQGMQVKQITQVKTNSILMQSLDEIPACTPILCLTSFDQNQTLSATDVPITTDSIYRTVHDSVWATTLNTTLTDPAMQLGIQYNRPYYLVHSASTTVSAFTAVIRSTQKNGYAVYASLLTDPNYATLADSINSAYHLAAAHEHEIDAAVVSAFRDSIQVYEQAFSTYSYPTYIEGSAAIKQLIKLMQKFLNGTLADELAAGIVRPSIPSSDSSSAQESGKESTQATYYTIDGRQIATPRSGLIIIKRGGTVRKVFVK